MSIVTGHQADGRKEPDQCELYFYRPAMRGLWSEILHFEIFEETRKNVPMCRIPLMYGFITSSSGMHVHRFLTVSSPGVHVHRFLIVSSPGVHEHRFQTVSSPEVRAHRFLTASSR